MLLQLPSIPYPLPPLPISLVFINLLFFPPHQEQADILVSFPKVQVQIHPPPPPKQKEPPPPPNQTNSPSPSYPAPPGRTRLARSDPRERLVQLVLAELGCCHPPNFSTQPAGREREERREERRGEERQAAHMRSATSAGASPSSWSFPACPQAVTHGPAPAPAPGSSR